MRLMRSAALVTAAVAAATLGLGAQAAQASSNSGWVYTANNSGAVYFDADLNGYPGLEKITVCDNKSDGRGIEAVVTGYDGDGQISYVLDDPSNDGHCASASGNFFLEDTSVSIVVYEYWGSSTANYGYGSAVA
ncbi:MAG: hypothetical protein HOY76_39695 [Streptomyces sp.]|nr:hypothetical protein [Streptomyces sp.]NUS14334.1 hypothetical protein [Streptomyces sp.]